MSPNQKSMLNYLNLASVLKIFYGTVQMMYCALLVFSEHS